MKLGLPDWIAGLFILFGLAIYTTASASTPVGDGISQADTANERVAN